MHENLVALGFIEFVKAAKPGYLFIRIGRKTNPQGPIDGVYKRLLEFIRSIMTDPEVQPNHAWRFTFKTRGNDAGIDTLTLDALCGHAPDTKGNDYTRVTLQKRIEAITRFSRYTA